MVAMASGVMSVVLLAMVSMMGSSQAYDFYVGGRDGWVQNPSENFNHWAERNRFQVNDRLVFKYKQGEDAVLVVTAADYSACNTSNPLRRLDGGDSVFQFDRSGPFFFISSVPGRCQGGQKLIVVVLAVRGHKTTTPPPPPATAPPPSPSPSPSPAPAPAAETQPSTAPAELPAAPVPAPSASSSSSSGASFRTAAVALVMGGGAFLLW